MDNGHVQVQEGIPVLECDLLPERHPDGAISARLRAGTGDSLRLNIGAGGRSIAGFRDIDRDLGSEAYPLDVEDGSVEEILASHVLEHFGHGLVGEVLAHWVKKLQPGGKIRLAVPDTEKICTAYLAGQPVNIQGY